MAHTYSGYENTVKATIEKAVENRNMGDLILEVNIPMETVTEVTDNGPKTVERKVFPGYVLVKMVMTDETWHLVRNVRGVTGFVGSGNKPIPLTEAEIASLGVEKKRSRRQLCSRRQRPHHRRRTGVFLGRRGRDRPGTAEGPGHRVHVRPGDPGGAGPGSNRIHLTPRVFGEKRFAGVGGAVRRSVQPHFHNGGALSGTESNWIR